MTVINYNEKSLQKIICKECEYYKKNGKCRIPHYQNGIKFVNCNCEDWHCAFKQLIEQKSLYQDLQEEMNVLRLQISEGLTKGPQILNKDLIQQDLQILKDKINMSFILFLNNLESLDSVEQTIYSHLNAFVKKWNNSFCIEDNPKKFERNIDET